MKVEEYLNKNVKVIIDVLEAYIFHNNFEIFEK